MNLIKNKMIYRITIVILFLTIITLLIFQKIKDYNYKPIGSKIYKYNEDRYFNDSETSNLTFTIVQEDKILTYNYLFDTDENLMEETIVIYDKKTKEILFNDNIDDELENIEDIKKYIFDNFAHTENTYVTFNNYLFDKNEKDIYVDENTLVKIDSMIEKYNTILESDELENICEELSDLDIEYLDDTIITNKNNNIEKAIIDEINLIYDNIKSFSNEILKEKRKHGNEYIELYKVTLINEIKSLILTRNKMNKLDIISNDKMYVSKEQYDKYYEDYNKIETMVDALKKESVDINDIIDEYKTNMLNNIAINTYLSNKNIDVDFCKDENEKNILIIYALNLETSYGNIYKITSNKSLNDENKFYDSLKKIKSNLYLISEDYINEKENLEVSIKNIDEQSKIYRNLLDELSYYNNIKEIVNY